MADTSYHPSRAEVLAAFRSDDPSLAKASDNDLWAAIATDHPDIAKSIKELQAPPSAPDDKSGFVNRFLETSGLGSIGHAVMHPMETMAEMNKAGEAENARERVGGLSYVQNRMAGSPIHNTPTPEELSRIPVLGPTGVAMADEAINNPGNAGLGMLGAIGGGLAAYFAPHAVSKGFSMLPENEAIVDNLRTRAANNRMKANAPKTAQGSRGAITAGDVVASGIGYGVKGAGGAAALEAANVARRSRPYLLAKAAVQQNLADLIQAPIEVGSKLQDVHNQIQMIPEPIASTPTQRQAAPINDPMMQNRPWERPDPIPEPSGAQAMRDQLSKIPAQTPTKKTPKVTTSTPLPAERVWEKPEPAPEKTGVQHMQEQLAKIPTQESTPRPKASKPAEPPPTRANEKPEPPVEKTAREHQLDQMSKIPAEKPKAKAVAANAETAPKVQKHPEENPQLRDRPWEQSAAKQYKFLYTTKNADGSVKRFIYKDLKTGRNYSSPNALY